jgi:hypothetical protein
MDDRDAVARQVDIQFEAVGAERDPVFERRHRVLRRERASASMREDQGARRIKKGMSHLL